MGNQDNSISKSRENLSSAPRMKLHGQFSMPKQTIRIAPKNLSEICFFKKEKLLYQESITSGRQRTTEGQPTPETPLITPVLNPHPHFSNSAESQQGQCMSVQRDQQASPHTSHKLKMHILCDTRKLQVQCYPLKCQAKAP